MAQNSGRIEIQDQEGKFEDETPLTPAPLSISYISI